MAMEKNYRHINKDIHYFCLMQPIQSIFGIAFGCSSDNFEWFECFVDEERYKVDDNYKITLRALNGNAYEHYYQDDFLSLIYSGCIVPKTNEDIHVEHVDFYEPIPNSIAYLHHEGQMLVGTFDPLKEGDTARIRSFSFLVTVDNIDLTDNTVNIHWTDDEGTTHFDVVELDELVKVI